MWSYLWNSSSVYPKTERHVTFVGKASDNSLRQTMVYSVSLQCISMRPARWVGGSGKMWLVEGQTEKKSWRFQESERLALIRKGENGILVTFQVGCPGRDCYGACLFDLFMEEMSTVRGEGGGGYNYMNIYFWFLPIKREQTATVLKKILPAPYIQKKKSSAAPLQEVLVFPRMFLCRELFINLCYNSYPFSITNCQMHETLNS